MAKYDLWKKSSLVLHDQKRGKDLKLISLRSRTILRYLKRKTSILYR